MTKLEKTFMVIMTTILIGLLASIIFVLAYPFKVQTAYTVPFEVITPKVVQGGTVGYKLHFEKHINAEAQVDRSLICDKYDPITVSNGYSNYPKGEVIRINYLSIPTNVPVGTCHLRITINYTVYLIRTITYTYDTQDFQVLPKDEKTVTVVNKLYKEEPVIVIPETINPTVQTESPTNNDVLTVNKGILTNLINKLF